jgi:predicted SAM-dependent methyltransferase
MKLKSAIKKVLNTIYYTNINPKSGYICPVCNTKSRKFIPYSRNKKQNARCPKCKSLDRHRLLWLFLKDNPELFSINMKLLHFAPEPCLEKEFKKMKDIIYITADIDPDAALIATDITNICFKENYFDAIICNHILEHINDDKTAMQEIYRILKPDGWAILMVPIDTARDKTYENSLITSPSDRLEHFEQEDHVRIYGQDYTNRLYNAGFTVHVIDQASKLHEKQKEIYKIQQEEIYFCKKE